MGGMNEKTGIAVGMLIGDKFVTKYGYIFVYSGARGPRYIFTEESGIDELYLLYEEIVRTFTKRLD